MNTEQTQGNTFSPEDSQQSPGTDARQKIIIPERLLHPHPLIIQTKRLHQMAHIDQYKRYLPTEGCLAVYVTPQCRKRAYLVMDTILKECKKRGWPVEIPAGWRGGTVISVSRSEQASCLQSYLQHNVPTLKGVCSEA